MILTLLIVSLVVGIFRGYSDFKLVKTEIPCNTMLAVFLIKFPEK